MEIYHKLKEEIQRKNKEKVRQIIKKSQKKCLIKEEKKAHKFFEENQNYFRYPGYQCHLRHERPSTLLHVTLAFIKTRKPEINRYNQLQDLGLHLFSCLSACHHLLPCFLEGTSKPAFLLHYS